jgi:predicted Zn finger-like uncharacterized protein
MLIVCPSCATSYDVEAASLLPNGRQVRCVRCRSVWHATPTQAERLAAAAAALAPKPDPAFAEAPARRPATPSRAAPLPGVTTAPAADRPQLEPQSAATAQRPDELAEMPEPVAGAWSVDAVAFEPPEADAPPIAPVDLDEGRPPVDIEADPAIPEAHYEDIETVAARGARQSVRGRKQGWPMSHLHTAILALVIVDSVLVGWRSDLVRAMPQLASFYGLMGMAVNVRGLEFRDVATVREEHGGVPILVVQGNIVSEAAAPVSVPRLKLVLRNAAKQEIYAWTAAPPRAVLSPGQAVGFRTRLASPPPDGNDIIVRFITRRDVVADTR